jgi:hypothetical protein
MSIFSFDNSTIHHKPASFLSRSPQKSVKALQKVAAECLPSISMQASIHGSRIDKIHGYLISRDS